MSSRIQALKRWLPLCVLFALIVAVWALGLAGHINLETIKAERTALLESVQERPVTSAVVFAMGYAAAVALSLPVAALLTLLSGFLFGAVAGTVIVVVGATAGATVIFLVARSSIGAAVKEKAGPLYSKVAAAMEKDAVRYMLFMRLVPLFPFFLVNIVPALFNVRLVPYVLTTMIGIIPGTFIYAHLGRTLGTIDTLRDLISPQTLGAFTLLGALALVPIGYRYWQAKR